ncbi:MAG: RloB domain-containing protein [Alcaligenaceae bacterium]|nr:RloB domain-containing protein [Alcaligenaceae bacterium]
MGSEDLFHKRKARKNSELKRQKRERAQNTRYLIVCEGTKTEPRYLREFLDDLKIRPQLVHIMPNNGVTPDRIVEHAINLYEEDKIAGDAFDKVYCVFDRDKHTTFSSAVKRIKDLGHPFVAITSTPCFEFWLLLHFIYTNKPFHAAGKNQSAIKSLQC